ncbi:hypothetical protein AAFF_G00360790, partial [Aldrovandia affinis]
MLDSSGERVKMEREDGVSGEVGLWMKQEKERNEPMERDVTDQTPKTEKVEKNGGTSKSGKQEEEELSTLPTSFLLKQLRVLIPRLEIMGHSVLLSSPPCPMASKEDQGVRSPWRLQELSPLRGMRSLRQKGQVMTPKRKTIGQLERPLKGLSAPSENGICAEASHSSPVISPRNQNTGQTLRSSQVFACSQCPFVHTVEVKLHQHIEKVHPDEQNRSQNSGGNGAENPLPPSSTQKPTTPTKTLPTPTQSHTGTPGAHTCSQCGKSYKHKTNLTVHQQIHSGENLYHCSHCGKNFTRSSGLIVHQRTHTGVRPYQCSQCGKSFIQSSHLTEHQRTHTGERPYHCSLCGKNFISSSQLIIHQGIHTGERPYHCSQCGKNFINSSQLIVHQRTH